MLVLVLLRTTRERRENGRNKDKYNVIMFILILRTTVVALTLITVKLFLPLMIAALLIYIIFDQNIFFAHASFIQ